MRHSFSILLGILLSVCSSLPSSAQEVKRGELFDQANYAMFIHWGLYSHLAGEWNQETKYGVSEWILRTANINPDEYMAEAKHFNPTDFDARSIVQLAKDAGMRYIIITSKHHDGFAMYHSKVNSFNIVDATPFGRDPMKELADACHEMGVGFGFYYSQYQDWTCPGGGRGPRVNKELNPVSFDEYFRTKCVPQVEEITRNYGDIELIWFDTPGNMGRKYAEELVDIVHRNQPKALVSSRVGHNLGDYTTMGDMEVPTFKIPGLWETVDTTNDSWGFSKCDNNWKSAKQILSNLIATVARGGTYMLNIGPDGKGNVPEAAQRALRSAGKWIKQYPQVIYGAKPSPFTHALPWGDMVQQENKLFLAVYDWPNTGRLYIPGLRTPIISARLLDGTKGKKLSFSTEDGWTVMHIPGIQPDKLVSVIELTMKDEDIVVDDTPGIDPQNGMNNLSTLYAKAEGTEIKINKWMDKFGEWKQTHAAKNLRGAKLVWTVDFKEAGYYHIQAGLKGNERVAIRLDSDEGEHVLNQRLADSTYDMRPIGWIKIHKPGKHTLTLTTPDGCRPETEVNCLSITPVLEP